MERQFDLYALLAELEESVAAAVDDLVDVLNSRQVKAQVKHVVSEMEKVPTPAALADTPSGVAAPTGAEYVVSGQIADADWDFLLVAANARAACVRDTAEENALLWLGMGSNRRAGDSDSDEEDAQPAQLSRKRQKENRYARTPKSCALKPKSKWRKWRPRSRRCVGQSRLSRQRKSKASRKIA